MKPEERPPESDGDNPAEGKGTDSSDAAEAKAETGGSSPREMPTGGDSGGAAVSAPAEAASVSTPPRSSAPAAEEATPVSTALRDGGMEVTGGEMVDELMKDDGGLYSKGASTVSSPRPYSHPGDREGLLADATPRI